MENLAGLGRRFFAYLVDWYIGALVTAFPVSAVSMKLFQTVKNQNLLTFPAPWGLIAGGLGWRRPSSTTRRCRSLCGGGKPWGSGG